MIVVEYSYSGWTPSGNYKQGTASVVLDRDEPSSADELEEVEREIATKVHATDLYETLETNVLNIK